MRYSTDCAVWLLCLSWSSLHPMVICGSVIGALLFYFQQCDAFPGIAQSPWWLVVLAMLWSFTMIPVPKGLEVRG